MVPINGDELVKIVRCLFPLNNVWGSSLVNEKNSPRNELVKVDWLLNNNDAYKKKWYHG